MSVAQLNESSPDDHANEQRYPVEAMCWVWLFHINSKNQHLFGKTNEQGVAIAQPVLVSYSRKVSCNIHDGSDSTIMILKHRLKIYQGRPDIEIIRDYGNLPELKCFSGQINQVFMNLLANAIDALDESNIGRSYDEIAIPIK